MWTALFAGILIGVWLARCVNMFDDLLFQPSWPAGHAARVPELVAKLDMRHDVSLVKLPGVPELLSPPSGHNKR
jgi:hypothetical protein